MDFAAAAKAPRDEPSCSCAAYCVRAAGAVQAIAAADCQFLVASPALLAAIGLTKRDLKRRSNMRPACFSTGIPRLRTIVVRRFEWSQSPAILRKRFAFLFLELPRG
jgi:hypothetical protein